MNPQSAKKITFEKEFTKQEPIPAAGIQRAVELMESGRLHRYNTAAGEVSEAALLEKEFAEYVGARYCAGFSSCGSAIKPVNKTKLINGVHCQISVIITENNAFLLVANHFTAGNPTMLSR